MSSDLENLSKKIHILKTWEWKTKNFQIMRSRKSPLLLLKY